MNVRSQCRFFFIASLLAACGIAGCSKNDGYAGTVQVTGKVTHNGQPLTGAVVTFIGDGAATPGAGISGDDGAYSVRLKPGNYTATISKLTVPPPSKDLSMEEALTNASSPPEEPKETLPAQYQDPVQSPFKVEVKASVSNVHDLNLSV